MTRSSKGFTLIELLVVIAIIGILSGVVLASLNNARAKGADAAVKSNLANARAEAELYYDSNTNSYGTAGSGTGVCAPFGNNVIGDSVNAADATGSGTSNCLVGVNGGTWAANAGLKSTTQFYCVDSTGVATTTATDTLNGDATTAAVSCI